MKTRAGRFLNTTHGVWLALLLTWYGASLAVAGAEAIPAPPNVTPLLMNYFDQMCEPKPFMIRSGKEFTKHQRELRQQVLECAGLWPLPERIPLDIQMTEPLDHPWCAVRRVYYQLWPGVYASGLLYLPKNLSDSPAPGMLCPHGHWSTGNAHEIVQSRCLMFARLGYITFSPNQNHYEDLNLGISHQTIGIWSNLRALDYLESLPQVDRQRLGVCGESGGGLQTQMLAALDERVRAATIAGMTCPFREILFPHAAHCDCNHFPNIMRYCDMPELAALALPTPVQFLTMNDWTRRFGETDFPLVHRLYAAHGLAERTVFHYEPTGHTYDRSKRELTYAWMAQWVQGKTHGEPVAEPANLFTFPPQKLLDLRRDSPSDNAFGGVNDFYRKQRRYRAPVLANPAELAAWRAKLAATLPSLLGEAMKLPRDARSCETLSITNAGGLVVEHVSFASEGSLRVPALILHPAEPGRRLPVTILCLGAGKEAALVEGRRLAMAGALVALPDVRFAGEYSPDALAHGIGPDQMRFQPFSMLSKPGDVNSAAAALAHAWERNAILWGRPLAGMACTDMQSVIDGIAARPDADTNSVCLRCPDSATLSVAALFAAALNPRITRLDLDLQNNCLAGKTPPTVPFVLWCGDVLQWAALSADRQLTLRHLPPAAGDPAWLSQVFELAGNARGLTIRTD